MKRLLFSLLLALTGCLAARGALVDTEYLVVHLRSGATVRFALREAPVITFDGDTMTIATSRMRFDDVAKYTFVTAPGDDGRPEISIDLASGWNWVSHPMAQAVAVATFQPGAERIVSQTDEMMLDIVYGWVGGIDSLHAVAAYKVQMTQPRTFALVGEAYDVAAPIVLHRGWNWVGYPAFQTTTVAYALAPTQVEEGDLIYGQESFAEYADGAWHGLLEQLVPGQGYLYRSVSDKALRYQDAPYQPLTPDPAPRHVRPLPQASPWVADAHRYPNQMALVARLCDGPVAVTDTTLVVGAFCGEECRGAALLNDGLLMLSVYGHGGEDIALRAIDAQGRVTAIDEHFRFDADLHGSVKRPLTLHLEASANVIDALTAPAADPAEWYRPDGLRVKAPTPGGLYIERRPDGSAHRVWQR